MKSLENGHLLILRSICDMIFSHLEKHRYFPLNGRDGILNELLEHDSPPMLSLCQKTFKETKFPHSQLASKVEHTQISLIRWKSEFMIDNRGKDYMISTILSCLIIEENTK